MRVKEQALKLFAIHVASQLILSLEETDSGEDKCGAECLLSQTFNQLGKKKAFASKVLSILSALSHPQHEGC